MSNNVDLAEALRGIINNLSPGLPLNRKVKDACKQGKVALAAFDAQFEDHSTMIEQTSLIAALWWFIENVDEADLHRTKYFFRLRERIAEEGAFHDAAVEACAACSLDDLKETDPDALAAFIGGY